MHVSRETEVMIACSRLELDRDHVDTIRVLSRDGLNWLEVIKTSTQHKVLPLVFHNLSRLGSDIFPDRLRSQLEESYILENSLHNLALVEELFLILNLFKEKGVVVVPFKGPVLAQELFGDISMRRYLDLDLLISKSDAERAVGILLDNGYVPEADDFPGGEGRRGYLERLVSITLVQSKKQLSVDLQWDISNRFSNVPIVVEDVADRLEQVLFDGRAVASLPVEELLCYLCLHGAKHRWLCLEYVCCVAELIRVRRDIDWEYTGQYAKRLGCTNVLLLGISLARDLLGAGLPVHMERRLNEHTKIQPLVDKVTDGLFSGYRDTMVTSEKFDPFLFEIKDNLSDRIRYCLKVVFIPSKEDLRVFVLPESLAFLRYVLRPLRLFAEYVRRRMRPFAKPYIKKN